MRPKPWPGLFGEVHHAVPEPGARLMVLVGHHAQQLHWEGRTVAFAPCGRLCWANNGPVPNLPWCPDCFPAPTERRR